jgi:hypothetical protein
MMINLEHMTMTVPLGLGQRLLLIAVNSAFMCTTRRLLLRGLAVEPLTHDMSIMTVYSTSWVTTGSRTSSNVMFLCESPIAVYESDAVP